MKRKGITPNARAQFSAWFCICTLKKLEEGIQIIAEEEEISCLNEHHW
jgi:hypothetical protein